ncbi:hypothetical protein [Amycolatopsis eburnea]|uniref:Cytochrome C biogenesis protein n=1 Tax=Amycolatopsis eburnea TaxID=2267691 RepID=A0A427THQ2_9PSEU|nr:hypothetical protein [Amycolatopsis eburnea]RSD22906.1 hypothetical protein EIY87_07065 [Amycolatopsis eburnea]
MPRLKIEVTVPESHAEAVIDALHEAGAGRVGRYARCTSVWQVTGTWLPLPGSQPYDGRARAVQQAVRAAHPYEEAVIRFLPLHEP